MPLAGDTLKRGLKALEGDELLAWPRSAATSLAGRPGRPHRIRGQAQPPVTQIPGRRRTGGLFECRGKCAARQAGLQQSLPQIRCPDRRARSSQSCMPAVRCPAAQPRPLQPGAMAELNVAALAGALRARFDIVQLLSVDGRGGWEVVLHVLQRSMFKLVTADALEALLWVHERHRAAMAVAVQGAVDSNAEWKGVCDVVIDPSVSWTVEVLVTPLQKLRSRSCLLTAQRVRESERAALESDRRGLWTLAASAAGLGLVVVESSAAAVKLDDTAAHQLGLPDAAEAGLSVHEWINRFLAEDRERLVSLVETVPTAGQTHSLSVRMQRRDGRHNRVLELSFRGSGDGTRWVGASRDVTQERSLEELRRKKVAAERANRAKTEFMSQVSHELRTPLNGILGFAQLMLMDKENPLSGEQLRRAEVLNYSGGRLLGLINQLLEVSRIEQGRRSMRIRSVNVASVFRRSLEQLQPMADRSNVSIETLIEQPERAAVRADAAALEQVVLNLVSNAIKYNRPEGQVSLSFSSEDRSVIRVEDTGRGMTDSEMGRLFEPFNRLSAQHSKVPGHGLGLTITRKLVESMDGELKVESTRGVGSIFSVYLPEANPSRVDTAETLSLELPSGPASPEERSVLYVEDDEVNKLLMEQVFLTQPGWVLRTVGTGAEGLRSAVEDRPQLILLDLNLPDMTGIEVRRALRADRRTRGIPCVAVSADAMPGQVRKVLAEGFEEHWAKPLDLPLLLKRLKERLA